MRAARERYSSAARALVLLGLPVLTADYDFWVSMDDIPLFNAVGARFDLHPSRPPDEARRHGRYVLENDEHVDVLVARSMPTVAGSKIEFEPLWARRQTVRLEHVDVAIPSIDDLILTKQVAARPKDLEEALNRTVTPDELQYALHREIPESERAEVEALFRWFTTRYPTPGERLRYIRHAYTRWSGRTP